MSSSLREQARSVPTEQAETAVLVQRMVSQIVLDLRFRGYVNHDGDRDWVKEASAWDRIGARLFGLPVCPSCGRFDGRHDDDCACQPMNEVDSDSFESSAPTTPAPSAKQTATEQEPV